MSVDPTSTREAATPLTLTSWLGRLRRAHALEFVVIVLAVYVGVVLLAQAGVVHRSSWLAETALSAVAGALGAGGLSFVRRRDDQRFAASIAALQRVTEGDLVTHVAVGSGGQAGLIEAATAEIVQQLRQLADRGRQWRAVAGRGLADDERRRLVDDEHLRRHGDRGVSRGRRRS